MGTREAQFFNWSAEEVRRGKSVFLLGALLLIFLVHPILVNWDLPGFRKLLEVFLSVVLLTAVYAVSQKKRHILVASCLAVPGIGLIWARHGLDHGSVAIGGFVLLGAFFGYVAALKLAWIFRTRKVTGDTIAAALAVYLLLGMIWFCIYAVMFAVDEGSFSLPELPEHIRGRAPVESQFSYYSFVTLTTLGYGDITPVSPSARMFSALEAVTGQFFTVVLVARLVGLQIVHETSRLDEK